MSIFYMVNIWFICAMSIDVRQMVCSISGPNNNERAYFLSGSVTYTNPVRRVRGTEGVQTIILDARPIHKTCFISLPLYCLQSWTVPPSYHIITVTVALTSYENNSATCVIYNHVSVTVGRLILNYGKTSLNRPAAGPTFNGPFKKGIGLES